MKTLLVKGICSQCQVLMADHNISNCKVHFTKYRKSQNTLSVVTTLNFFN